MIFDLKPAAYENEKDLHEAEQNAGSPTELRDEFESKVENPQPQKGKSEEDALTPNLLVAESQASKSKKEKRSMGSPCRPVTLRAAQSRFILPRVFCI